MSISPRALTGVLLLLLAGFPVAAALPNDAASVRVAGMSILWWYGGIVAPVIAAATGALVDWRRAAEARTAPATAPDTGVDGRAPDDS